MADYITPDELSNQINSALEAGNIVIVAPDGMTSAQTLKELDGHLHGRGTTTKVYLFASPDPNAYGGYNVN